MVMKSMPIETPVWSNMTEHMRNAILDINHYSIPMAISVLSIHNDNFKWEHLPRYWPFVRGIHGSPVNSPHKGQWRGTLMFSLICTWTNCSANKRDAGDLRCHRAHYDVIVIINWNHKYQIIPNGRDCPTLLSQGQSGDVIVWSNITSQLALRRWPNVGIGRHCRDRQPTSVFRRLRCYGMSAFCRSATVGIS